jgi:hypothetical protein
MLSLTTVQRNFLGIIASVEAGLTTPVDAFNELNDLHAEALRSNISFTADYSVKDFELVKANADSQYSMDDSFYDDVDHDYENEQCDI